MKLSLTTAYNPEANGKIERGHGLIVKSIIRACNGRVGNWPRLLPYALWADRLYVNKAHVWAKADNAHRKMIASWVAIPWENEMSREELLTAWIRQLERRPKDLEHARKIMEVARVNNKIQFDKTHRLRPKKIEEGDWVFSMTATLTTNTKRQGSSQEDGSAHMW